MRWLKINLKKRRPDKFLFIVCAGLLILSLQCGKKGPPVAPDVVVPPAVKDLEAEVIEDRVRLTWSVLKQGDRLFDGLKHFSIYRYESDTPAKVCQGCPIPFKPFLDIKLDNPAPAQIEGDRVILYDKSKPGHSYAYKVVSYHKSGGMSPDSNIVFCVNQCH